MSKLPEEIKESKDASQNGSNKRSNQPRRNRGKGRNGRGSRGKKEDKLSVLKNDVNDSSFYYSDPLIREQITNFSFNQYAGVRFDVASTSSQVLSANVPTVMRIELAPSAGSGSNGLKNATDGVQRAALKNYVKLSASNAKTTNYQPQDIAKLMFAVSSIMENLSFAQRILGSVNVFNQRNRDLPQQLVEMQGVVYSDLTRNYADYLLEFNNILTLFNKIPIPANVPMFKKSAQIFSNFYVDDTSPLAQIYMMVPDGYWEFDEVNDRLEYKTMYTHTPGSSGYLFPTTYTFANLLNDIKAQINALLESATFNFIYSDILRLSDKEGMQLLTYVTVPFGYVAPMLYSDEFNLWVDNMTIAGRPESNGTNDNTPYNHVEFDVATNKVLYAPVFNYGNTSPLIQDYILNFTTNNPDTESKVAATRLVSALNRQASATLHPGIAYYLVASDHYVTEVAILRFNAADGTRAISRMPGLSSRVVETSTATASGVAILFNFLSKFKHAPRQYYSDTANGIIDVWFNGDLDYYTTVDCNYLSRMFDLEWLTYMQIG